MAFSTIVPNSTAVRADRQADITGDTLKTALTKVNTNFAQTANTTSPALTGTPTAPTPAEASNDTTIATTAFVKIKVASVSLTNAQVLALRGTPITIVPAPGAGFMNEFIKAELAFDYTAAYTESADNLAFKYVDGSGTAASAAIECTGFVDATADTLIEAIPATGAARAKALVDNAAIVLHNTGDGEFGGGNAANVIRVSVAYRIVPLGW